MNKYGYIRVAAGVPKVNVADCEANTKGILELAEIAYSKKADVMVFPELAVTAYTCGDLFTLSTLIQAAEASIERIRVESYNWHDMLVVVGAPLKESDKLYNCAVAIQNGEIVGVVPKTHLPNYGEFYEMRWFCPAKIEESKKEISIAGYSAPFGANLLFHKGSAKIGIEICEDLWTPIPPSSYLAQCGANLILNLSASDEVAGKHDYLLNLISQQSARCRVGYVYSSCGFGESTTDMVFGGNALICESGVFLAKSHDLFAINQLSIADIDAESLSNERIKTNTFMDLPLNISIREINLSYSIDDQLQPQDLLRNINALPFIPNDDARLNSRCRDIINIQVAGLMRRLDFTKSTKIVVGISGGLDSTLALLIAVETFDKLGYDRKNIYGITMPGFGTSDRTYTNAVKLINELGVTFKEIPIREAVIQHFSDIHANLENHDVTYENSQARERTQILMDYANKIGGLVLGTGDLSELALGWATYNGDHMSMYGVNSGVPKTLVRYLVKWYAETIAKGVEKETLLDIVATPISPELIPTANDGKIQQKTEDLVGPYELHDFFLYYLLAQGYAPHKIYFLARKAFAGTFSDDTIKKWLKVFFRRFFSQQFKRSCLPDGPKVESVSLSPRGDWRMPSDASAALWLKECDSL